MFRFAVGRDEVDGGRATLQSRIVAVAGILYLSAR